jgi:hypothetical protein
MEREKQITTRRKTVIRRTAARELYREYDQILAMLVDMIIHAEKWTLK